MKFSLVILDRDGVINHDSPNYIKALHEWMPIDGSIEAIARLSRAGYPVAVATNQAGVPKGFIPEHELDAMHIRLRALVHAAGGEPPDIHDCRHHPDEQCSCRKPQPGMLLAACEALNVPPSDAVFVGDSWSDIQAALAAGCQPVLVLTGNGSLTAQRPDFDPHIPRIGSLAELPLWLEQQGRSTGLALCIQGPSLQ